MSRTCRFRKTNFNPPFNITRASHLVFTVRDLAQSRDFYTEVMGLIVSDEDANTLWLRGVEERAHHSLTLKRTTGQPQCERIGFRVFMDEDLDQGQGAFRQDRHQGRVRRGAAPGPHAALQRSRRARRSSWSRR